MCVWVKAVMIAALLSLPSAGHAGTSAATGADVGITPDRIALTGLCLNHLDAYRGAIAFLEKRLKRSPPAVKFEMENGESITLFNRTHRIMQLEKRLLVSGMQARERACRLALRG